VATVKDNLRQRVTRRLVNAAGGGLVDDLLTRIQQLEDEVQENRNLNLKLAELIDVVQELLVPVASQDRDRIEAALARFERSL
jgi:cell shape-determining protein MreC